MPTKPSNTNPPGSPLLTPSLASELEQVAQLLLDHPDTGAEANESLALVRVLSSVSHEEWETFASSHGLENWLSLSLDRTASEAVAELLARQERLAYQRDHDALTGIANRGCFNRKLEAEVDRAIRSQSELSLLCLDLDNFKSVNDTYGHDCGDAVLKRLGSVLAASVRHYDIPARVGGEEFAVILPSTSCWTGVMLANRILDLFRKEVFNCGNCRFSMTFSGGVSCLSLLGGESKTGAALYKSADKALYAAKSNGKNTITLMECDKICKDRTTLVQAQEKQFLFSSEGLE